MLTRQDKQNIYALLTQSFPKNTKIPLAKVALYLKEQGLNYEEFGYIKMKSLLCDLSEFLELSVEQNGSHKNESVIIHDFNDGMKNNNSSKKAGPSKTTKKSLPSKGKVLTPLEKKKIQVSLLDSFDPNIDYPLAKVSKALLDQGINYRDYGFSKMKTFMSNLPEVLSLTQINHKGILEPTARVLPFAPNKPIEEKPFIDPHPAPYRKITPSRNSYENKGKAVSNTEPLEKTVEEKKPAKFAYPDGKDIFVPDKLLLSVKETINLGLEDSSIAKLITKSYEDAKSADKITCRDDSLIFPVSFKATNGDDIIGSIKKAAPNSSLPYFLNFIGSDKEKPKDALRKDIFFSDFEEQIGYLADIAIKEDWCYRHSKDKYIILKIYLQYTYYRLLSQNQVLVDKTSGFACFNTGLMTNDFQSIYAVMMVNQDKNIDAKYIFQGFTISASQGIGKIIVEHFNPLPKKAVYVQNVDEIVYDSAKDLHTDYQHIIFDNLDRFPIKFLKNVVMAFTKAKDILNDIIHENNEYQKSRLYEELEDQIKENDLLFTLIHASLDSAIKSSINCVNYDYRMALPSFFPTRNVMSMMLPLVFDHGEGVEAVLLVEKTPSGNYQGQTMLTLKMCYVNARLIGPLDNTFLKAYDIED